MCDEKPKDTSAFRNIGLRQKKSFVRKKQFWFYFLELVYIQSQYILNFNFLLCSLPEMYASPLTEHKDLDYTCHIPIQE